MEVPQIQPLEFTDFSGGITENYVQGDPRRYKDADNMFITVDKKLEERAGFVIDGADSYLLPGSQGRINGYFNILNDGWLVPQSARNLFTKNPDTLEWEVINGIAGHPALSGGDLYSQTTTAEYQNQVYLATDGEEGSNGVLPSKIYQNDSNVWVAKTAGLPRAWVNGSYSPSSLLAKCIVNANAIRASMLAHIKDSFLGSDPTGFLYLNPGVYAYIPGKLHRNWDRNALCYLETTPPYTSPLAPPQPNPLPTPAGDATNEASLFLLVGALNSAYTIHAEEAMINSWGTHPESVVTTPQVMPQFHQGPPVFTYAFSVLDYPLYKTKGPAAPLENNATPDSVEEAAEMLDDLLTKWNWHRLAVNVHDEANDYAVMNKYAPAITAIGTVQLDETSFPTVTPDWGDVIAFANNLRYIYNSHVTNVPGARTSTVHKMRDTNAYQMQCECTLPEATDLDSAFLLIYWLRSLYQLHIYDANMFLWSNIGFTSSTGSPNLTALNYDAGGGAVSGILGRFMYIPGLPLTSTLWPKVNQYSYPATYVSAKITASGAGTATIDRNVIAALGADYPAQVSQSMYHISKDGFTGQLKDASTVIEVSTSALGVDVTAVGTDIDSWVALGNDLLVAMGNHMQQANMHLGAFAAESYLNLVAAVPYPNFMSPTVSQVSYAMFFSDTYTVQSNGIEYLVQGNPIYSDSIDVAVSYPVGYVPPNTLYSAYYPAEKVITTRGNLLTNLPVLVNDGLTNYDVANVKLNIYRTTDGGQTYFLVAELPNGTTEYLDTLNDSVPTPGDTALNQRQKIYTSGGVVGFDQPPVCKFTHLINQTAYWGAVTDTGQFFPNRIVQSIRGAPDAAPSTFSIDLDSPVVGISSARNNPIAFCTESVYRLSGAYSSTGQGTITSENISDTLGALNAKGIVRTEVGVFFPGNDGFYYTDGYQVIPITLELKKTYAALTQTEAQCRKIQGTYDRISRKIHWAMSESPTGEENTVLYTFYLDYGVKPSGTFTLMRNGLNFQPASIVVQNGRLYMGHGKGVLLKYEPDAKWDIGVDITNPLPETWERVFIPYTFTSVAVDMGSTFNRKYVTKTHIIGRNTGNASIQPYVIRDLNEQGQGAVPLAPINYLGNVVWGDPRPIWGNDECIWKTDGKMDVWRRFPRNTLRSDMLQVQLKPSFACVYSSSNDYPEFAWVTVDGLYNELTIVTPPGYTQITWPLDCIGYVIRLATDDYTNSYTITAISIDGTVLFVSDPDGTLGDIAAPGVQWEIWGYKKEQRMTLTAMVISFAYLGQENQAYPGSKSNSGPGNGGQNP